MLNVDIYTDGACKGNPGVGGWGFYVIFDDSEYKMSGGSANTTNNRMELTAVIESLKYIDPNILLIYILILNMYPMVLLCG